MTSGMLTAIRCLTSLSGAAALLRRRFKRAHETAPPSPEQIDALLPQTQCGRCGYSACYPYAEAISRGEANINQCPPGGDHTIANLAKLLGCKPEPLNAEHGTVPAEPTVAWIDEAKCIGCTRCIQACPVDAILGAAKQMHTVIRSECTGCELCIEPCPVDCIHMIPVTEDTANRGKADLARERYRNRLKRLAREREERQRRIQRKKTLPPRDIDNVDKKAVIQAAVERARRRQAALAPGRAASTSRSE